MVSDHPPLGIENEITLDARKREIAAELAAVIDPGGAGRQDFDDNDGIVDRDRVVGATRAANDRRVRLKGGSRVDPDGEAVRDDFARLAGRRQPAVQSLCGAEVHANMRGPFRRHHHRNTVVQLPAPSLPLGPEKELVAGHA
jgi:hypothetical protein